MFHLVRIKLTKLDLCALGGDYLAGHLSVHPKVGLYYPMNLTQCTFHLVRMQLS